MKMANVLGALMLISLFAAIFVFISITSNVKVAIYVYGLIILITLYIVAAAWLLVK